MLIRCLTWLGVADNADAAFVGVIPIHMVYRYFCDDLVSNMAYKAIRKSYISGMRYFWCGQFRNSGRSRTATGGGGGYDDYHCYG